MRSYKIKYKKLEGAHVPYYCTLTLTLTCDLETISLLGYPKVIPNAIPGLITYVSFVCEL